VTSAADEIATAIEIWFQNHEDGEFAVLPSEHSSTVVGDRSASATVVYTTKPRCLIPNLDVFRFPRGATIVGRYGLPLPADLVLLSRQMHGNHHSFVGDADPPDIMIFAWLRAHVAIEWRGVCDELLNHTRIEDRSPIEIPMSEAETESLGVLAQLCPDFRQLIGSECSAALDRGFKIELEGLC